MKPDCQQVRRWLDDCERRPLPPDLKAHAASCPTCRAGVEAEEALREHLAEAPPIEPSRRAAILAHVSAATASTPRAGKRRRLLLWSLAPLAAAAAIVLAVVLAWPHPPRTPISPTEVFGDFLGPMVNFLPPPGQPENAARQPASGKEPSTADNVLATFWSDIEGPLTVALGAMEAPRVAAGLAPAAQNTKPQTR